MLFKPEPEHIGREWNPVHPDPNIHFANHLHALTVAVYRQIELPYAMSLSIEERVLWHLRGALYAHSMSDLERVFCLHNLRKDGEVTVRTAIKRLMKAGKVAAKWHERGWFRWYSYHAIDTKA